jgi:hypothetical protein
MGFKNRMCSFEELYRLSVCFNQSQNLYLLWSDISQVQTRTSVHLLNYNDLGPFENGLEI